MSKNDMIFREMNNSGGSVFMIKSPDLMIFKSLDELIKEWIFWLSYVDCNTKKEIDVITNKKAKDLTKQESEKLRTYQEELTLLKVLKKYPNKNLSRDERTLVYKSLNTKIENLIIKKLSDKQINDAKKIYQSAKNESLEEIDKWLASTDEVIAPILRYVRFLLLKRGLVLAMQNLDKRIQAEHNHNLAVDYRKRKLCFDKWNFIK